MKLKYSIFLAYLFLVYYGTHAQEKQYKVAAIAFYNVENLFDTLDSETTNDEEYLPKGKNQWTPSRYEEKSDRMAKVLSQLAVDIVPDGPAIIGVSEIENRSVLEDLLKSEYLKNRNYQIVHYESPDNRGVDVGLLYNPSIFKVTSSKSIFVPMPDPKRPTRDILLVSGFFDGEEMHVLVNHWPSRRGGSALRNNAASVARGVIDSILLSNAMAKIILMGDLNDNPNNESVTKYINAKDDTLLSNQEMYNTMAKFYNKGIGTLAYRDVWNLFDQIIISKQLVGDDKTTFKYYKSVIFKKEYMIQQEGRFKGYPLRTFAGGRYTEGYSDHFPVYILLAKEIK